MRIDANLFFTNNEDGEQQAKPKKEINMLCKLLAIRLLSVPLLSHAIVPALAGFQSEHAVDIPFMLTMSKTKKKIANLAARGSKTRLIEKVWDYSTN